MVTMEPPEAEVLEWHPPTTVIDRQLHGVVPESGTTPEARLMSYEDQNIKDLMERMQDRGDHEAEPFQMDIEINNLEMTPEEKKKYDQIDITMDSGAGASVANPKNFPGCTVTDSPGSLAGQHFVGPAGEKICNEG